MGNKLTHSSNTYETEPSLEANTVADRRLELLHDEAERIAADPNLPTELEVGEYLKDPEAVRRAVLELHRIRFAAAYAHMRSKGEPVPDTGEALLEAIELGRVVNG